MNIITDLDNSSDKIIILPNNLKKATHFFYRSTLDWLLQVIEQRER
jgi:hypothetical protein